MRGFINSTSLSNEIPVLMARRWAEDEVVVEDLYDAIVAELGRVWKEPGSEDGEESDGEQEQHWNHALHCRLAVELLSEVPPAFLRCPKCEEHWI